MAFVNERSEMVWESRTIDYNRDAILKRGATQGWYVRMGQAESFTLTWKGQPIEFGALYKFENKNEKKSMIYFIERCVYPDSLLPFKKQIAEILVEALTTYGISYGTDDGTEIIVKIDPNLSNLQSELTQKISHSFEFSKSFH